MFIKTDCNMQPANKSTEEEEETDCNAVAVMIRHLYCTAGAGMEELLAEEVQHKLCATQVEQIPGRVFFCSNADLQTVTQLKSAERLFILLRKAEPVSLPNNPAKAAAVIKQRVVGDPDIWRQTFLTWTALQQELQCSQQHGQKRKREDEEESLHTPSFRVSCRCSGVIARSYTSQRLSRIIGMAIKEDLGWKVNLREPVFEVNVYLSDDHCIVGIPLLKHPLSSRSYMKHNGLRSTIAWAMSSLCPKKLNDCVILDPMCGVGAVLLEAAQEYSNAVFLGMDTDLSQLQKAAENVKASGMEGRVQLLQSSAMEIPLADGTVDAVLCDVPFGRKFSCSSDMPTALPRLLREMERVLRVGGHLVLLLSLQLSAQLKKTVCTHEHNQNVNSLDTNNLHTDPSNTHNESTDTPKPLMFHKSSSEMSNSPLLISSLQAQRTHRVSLGSTDAFIHTYTKIKTQTLSH
ncbi:THUMP domain-containing protein 2 isoform X1 [Sinocyclocheilus anshuiensis]|uniref:THUMP domain-containing protein 2 isoform X1 n=2 Tax=Sinocyclocheilus anshuiensis TaxID=1608454 RepID=UPI0007B878C1|nr:PREDICTED: THUMP domain-containing protein 2 isoform X1 [Sinocyclocheilus anshuiensis]